MESRLGRKEQRHDRFWAVSHEAVRCFYRLDPEATGRLTWTVSPVLSDATCRQLLRRAPPIPVTNAPTHAHTQSTTQTLQPHQFTSDLVAREAVVRLWRRLVGVVLRLELGRATGRCRRTTSWRAARQGSRYVRVHIVHTRPTWRRLL